MTTDIQYITHPKDFEKAISSLSKQKQLFIDLEFDKNHFRYGFNLCLMQIFDGVSTCYLIDPLSEIDISKIFPVLANENIQLVCYAFNEDMRLLHHIGVAPKNILDLSIPIRLLNYDMLSLNNALVEFLEDGEYAEKITGQQKSNWCLRPLTQKQKEYAQEDVIFLPALQHQLEEKIKNMGREKWVREEMMAFEKHDWNNGSSTRYLTPKDKKSLTLREWIRFKKLMHYREDLAQSLNRPTYKVISKNLLITLSKAPQLADSDTSYKGIHPKLKTKELKEKFQMLLKKAEKEIEKNNIPVGATSKEIRSEEERKRLKQQKKRVQHLTDSFFLPIKEKMKQEYGIHFSNYFLSNRKIKDYSTQEQRLLPYQKKLIVKIANELNLILPEVITN